MNQHDELHDRLVDSALCEVAGGHAPPDLSARILAAVETPVTLTEDTKMERPNRNRRVWIALAIAACLLVAAGFLLPAMESAIETARNSAGQLISDHVNGPPRNVSNDSKSTDSASASPQHKSQVTVESAPLPREIGDSLANQSVPPSQYHESMLQSSGRPVADSLSAVPASASLSDSPGRGYGGEGGQGQPSSAPAADSKAVRLRYQSQGSLGYMPQAPGQQAEGEYGGDRYASAGKRVTSQPFFSTLDERTFDQIRVPTPLGATPQQQRDAQGEGPGLPGDQYARIYENPFIEARGEQAVSTFSIDVDTASYANVRKFLKSGQLPPPDAVRLEELINYFDYQYEAPAADSETPFSTAMEVAGCPWEPKHRLVRVALQGRELDKSKRPVSNLVFLIDVSGSMNEPSKLPLVVEGMKQLVRELGENDRVAIVVYASSEGLVLPSTPGTEQSAILEALDRLQAGGSTAGGAGIQLAYQMAEDHFVTGGVNRVILCTDGDFNVGVTSTADLERMVEQKAKDTKVFLSVLGFGRGNLNDAMMETISNHGNGNYHYVDNLSEARKVLVEEMTGTLVTIAKDVKIQVEFNPAQVAGCRLLGYENRMLRTEDFNDDKKDAGEIGAGHRVTAIYEIVPAGEKVDLPPVDDLKYQQSAAAKEPAADNKELLTLKLRFKPADGDTSTKVEFPLTDEGKAFSAATPDFKFAAAVASFGMLLRDSEHKGNATFDAVLEIATEGASHDPHGYRAEFLELVRIAKSL